MILKYFNNLSLKNKIIAIIVVFYASLFAIIYFIDMPIVRSIVSIKNDTNEQRAGLEKRYLERKKLKKLSGQLEEAEEMAVSLDKVFINQNRSLEFITTLEAVASKNNMSQKINLLSSVDSSQSTYKKTPLQLSASGSSSDYVNYLIDLETLSYYINIKSLDITFSSSGLPESKAGAGQRNVSLLIMADTYWE